jgi:hypothetical protein
MSGMLGLDGADCVAISIKKRETNRNRTKRTNRRKGKNNIAFDRDVQQNLLLLFGMLFHRYTYPTFSALTHSYLLPSVLQEKESKSYSLGCY